MIVLGEWLLTPERAAVHLPTGTAVVADLHIGYDEARRRGGEALPLFSAAETALALRPLLVRPEVRALIVAGDLCESAAGVSMIDEALGELDAAGVTLAGIVPGNHDRGLSARGRRLPLRPDGVRLGAWQVVHGDGELPEGRLVLGHFHPCLRARGHKFSCFLVGEDRIVLPAFSRDAAGVTVAGGARWVGYRCCAIVGGAVFDCGNAAVPRRRRAAAGGPR